MVKDQTYSEWRKAHTNDDGSLDCSIFWWHFSRLIRCLPDALIKQLPMTFCLIVGVISTPWALGNIASGFTTRQANYNQPSHGIILSQTGAIARQVVDIGGHVGGSTIQYVTNTQLTAPATTQNIPIQAAQIRQQYQPQNPTILGTGMGQY